MLKRRLLNDKPLKMYTKRFYPAGTYTWIVPPGCTEVDVFLVGAGSGAGQMYSGSSYGGGGGGYTKTYRGSGYVKPFSGTWMGTSTEGRDGDAISVTPGQEIEIIVGGGVSKGNGGYTQFMNSKYRAEGGKLSDRNGYGSSGGSGGSSEDSSSIGTGGNGGSDGSNGMGNHGGSGQGHTTRDFGEPSGKRNAGGGSACSGRMNSYKGGISDYTEGKGEDFNKSQDTYVGGKGGGGYGGGAGGTFGNNVSTKGGDGTVLIRYYAY